MNNQTIQVAMLGLFLGWFCAGCGQSKQDPSITVPPDCQKFLVKYFDAIKSKDIGKIEEYSSAVSPADSERLPEASVNMMRDAKKKFAAQIFEQMTKELGDLKSYSVTNMTEKTITMEELTAKNMQGASSLAGVHAEIVCKCKFSKAPALIRLNLYKATPESEYLLQAYRYQVER